MKTQRIAVTCLTVAAVTLAACSSSKTTGGASTTGPTSSAVDATAPATVAPATAPPATAPPATPAPTAPAPTGPNLYDQVDRPAVPGGHTDPFVSSGVLADGAYWVGYNGGEKLTPDVTVYQAFFGAECISKAAEVGDECLNDIFILDPPTRDINDLPFATDVHLTVSDSNTQLSYWISPDELVQIRASSPSAGAPAGYGFVPFAFLMTVQGGEIVKFEQVWTP